MKKRILFIPLLLSVLLSWQGCGSSKDTAAVSPQSPKVETTESQLTLDAMIIDAKTQQLIGNNDKATALFRSVLEKDPHYGAAQYELSKILANAGRMDSAILYAQQAVTACDTNVWYRIHLAHCYQNTADYTHLNAEWETIVKQHPDVIDYYYELSNSYLLSGNISKAIDALNRVEKKIGVTETVSLQKQKLWNAIGKTDKGRKEIEALANALPQEKRYSAILAESYMKEKNYPKAKTYYDKALAADPDDEYMHIAMASYHKAVGQQRQAYEELKKGFASPNIDINTKIQMLSTFYTAEEFYGPCSQYSYALLDDLMRQSDDSTSYALFYGDVLMRQDKYREAAHQFAIALTTKDSSRYELWEALLVCETEGNFGDDTILDHARRAANLFPLHSLPHYLQGAIGVKQKQFQEALGFFKTCEKIGFKRVDGYPFGYLEGETYILMGDSYHALKDYDNCFAYYDKYMAVDSNDIHILNNYAYYLSELDLRLNDAERMSAKTIDKEPDNATFLDTYAWVLYKLGRRDEALKYIRKAVANDKNDSETLREHLKIIEGTF